MRNKVSIHGKQKPNNNKRNGELSKDIEAIILIGQITEIPMMSNVDSCGSGVQICFPGRSMWRMKIRAHFNVFNQIYLMMGK